MREELLRVAVAGRTITYGYLMERYRIPRGHPDAGGIADVIGTIDAMESERGAPGFAPLVVRKDTGYPGGGFFCSDDVPSRLRRKGNQRLNPRLTKQEKEYVDTLRKKVWAYYRRVEIRKRW